MNKYIFNINFGNPFKSALIFLSHSWEDNIEADYLYKFLKKYFQVWYDRAYLIDKNSNQGLFFGKHVLPHTIITKADFILFLASEASMAESSIAKQELDIAENVCRKQKKLGLVELYPYKIPADYSAYVFEKFNIATAREDSKRIADSIKKRLLEIAGIIPLKGKSSLIVYQGGSNIDFLLDVLKNKPLAGLYGLNTILRAFEKEHLIRIIYNLPNEEKEKISENLLNIYINYDKLEYSIARQNAVYLLSRINSTKQELATEIQYRYPDEEESFLYRGFHIALGYLGDLNKMHEYVEQLANKRTQVWIKQRKINEDFHILYYGSKAGALEELRATIKNLSPLNLLELNVFTLGLMSNYREDIELLDSQTERLIKHNVDPKIIKAAKDKIMKKLR